MLLKLLQNVRDGRELSKLICMQALLRKKLCGQKIRELFKWRSMNLLMVQ